MTQMDVARAPEVSRPESNTDSKRVGDSGYAKIHGKKTLSTPALKKAILRIDSKPQSFERTTSTI